VNLTPDLAGFVQEQTKSGKYASVSEVVQEALRLFEAAEQIRARRLQDVKAKISEGLASLNRGEGLDGEEVSENSKRPFQEPEEKRAGDDPVSDLAACSPGLN